MGGAKSPVTTLGVSLLPLVFFVPLTLLSVKFIPVHLFTFEAELRGQCSPGLTSPSNIPYTGFPALDTELCFMVAFFHSALDYPLASDFLMHFIGTSSIYVIFPLLEGVRVTKSHAPSIWMRMLGYPEAWLALSQVASLGVAMSLYGLVFSLASASTGNQGVTSRLKQEKDAKAEKTNEGDEPGARSETRCVGTSRVDVESVAAATVLGAALPSWALFAYREPSKTVLWQAFPLYIFVARVGYRRVVNAISRFIRPASSSPPSNPSQPATLHDGYGAIRIVLLTSFALSAYFHLSFLSSVFSHPDAAILFNSISLKPPADTTLPPPNIHPLSVNVLIFLFWDFLFAFVSTFAALGLDALCTGKRMMESKMIIIGCGLGCEVVGPGAVLAICVLWREERLRKCIQCTTP